MEQDILVCPALFIYDLNGHEEEARKRGFRMDVGLRERKARSNPYIAHEVNYSKMRKKRESADSK